MLRRRFVAGLAGTALASVGGTVPAASEPTRINLPRSYVAGTAETAARQVARRLRRGAPLILKRSPNNLFDRRTIEVWDGAVKLGCLPGDDSRILAPLMDAGVNLRAAVHSVSPRPDKPHIRLNLSIGSAFV